jgi:RHS repeat-associated protein
LFPLDKYRVYPYLYKEKLNFDGILETEKISELLSINDVWKTPEELVESKNTYDDLINIFDDGNLKYKQVVKNHFSIAQGAYNILREKEETFGRNNKVLIAPTEYIYDDRGRLKNVLHNGRLSEMKYDYLGRVKDWKSFSGQNISFSYKGKTPHVKEKVSGRKKIIKEYTLIGKIKSLKEEEVKIDFEYSLEGIPLRMIKNKSSENQVVLYSVNLPSKIECVEEGTACYENKYSFLKNGQKVLLELDGLGRKVNTFKKVGNKGLAQTGILIFGDESHIVQVHSPSFKKGRSAVKGKYSFDHLGRFVKESHYGYQEKDIEHIYAGACHETIVEGISSKKCDNGFSGLSFSRYLDEEISVRLDGLGRTQTILPLGFLWEYDAFGNLKKSIVDGVESSRQYSPDMRKLSYSDGREYSFDERGLLEEFLNSDIKQKINYNPNLQILDNTIDSNRGISLQEKNIFNSDSSLQSKSLNSFKFNYDYDQYSNLKSINSKNNQGSLGSIIFNYTNGFLANLNKGISQIEYDANAKVKKVSFDNGLTLDIRRSLKDTKMRSLSYRTNNKIVHRKSYFYEDQNDESCPEASQAIIDKISKINTKKSKFGDSIEDICYTKGQVLESKRVNINFEENHLRQITKLGIQKLSWKGDALSQIGKVQIVTNSNGGLVASCDGDDCFYKFSDDLVSYRGDLIRQVKLDGFPVLLIINEKEFYPLLSDHKGSVTGIFDQEGELLVERKYGLWGEENEYYFNQDKLELAQKLNTYAVWGFSNMIQPPGLDIYFSQTRAYSPSLGRWLSFDSGVKWTPNNFFGLPGNWDGLKYCGNDPVNFIDPSGQNIIAAGLFVGGVGLIGAAFIVAGTAAAVTAAALVAAPTIIGIGFMGVAAYLAAPEVAFMASAHVARNSITYATASQVGGEIVSGAFDSAAPSTPWQSVGWALDKGWSYRHEISNSFNDFTSSFFTEEPSFYSENQFYEYTPTTRDSYSFGDWEFE